MGEILDALHDESYQIGPYQVLRYDPARVDIFPEGYLSTLYRLAKLSSRRSPQGILPELFCGMTDITHNTVTNYLSTRLLLILGEWESPSSFLPLGLAFPTVVGGTAPEKMIFAGYGYFLPFWGHPAILTLTVLGLAFFFREFGLLAVHGSRYASNDRTARLMALVGFHDVGRVPRYMLQDGKLTTMVVSSLLIEEFEERALPLLERIASGYGQGIIQQHGSSSSVRDAGQPDRPDGDR